MYKQASQLYSDACGLLTIFFFFYQLQGHVHLIGNNYTYRSSKYGHRSKTCHIHHWSRGQLKCHRDQLLVMRFRNCQWMMHLISGAKSPCPGLKEARRRKSQPRWRKDSDNIPSGFRDTCVGSSNTCREEHGFIYRWSSAPFFSLATVCTHTLTLPLSPAPSIVLSLSLSLSDTRAHSVRPSAWDQHARTFSLRSCLAHHCGKRAKQRRGLTLALVSTQGITGIAGPFNTFSLENKRTSLTPFKEEITASPRYLPAAQWEKKGKTRIFLLRDITHLITLEVRPGIWERMGPLLCSIVLCLGAAVPQFVKGEWKSS